MTQQVHEGVVPTWTVGDRLRKSRELTGRNRRDFGEDIDVSERSIANYETDRATPKRPVLLSWAMRTGVSLEWLATGQSGSGPSSPTETESQP